MKKIFAMLAAILFCGALMTSCNKDEKNEDNNSAFPTKADMVGTWEGTFTGTATVDDASENYTLNWTLILNPEGSNTVGSLQYTAEFATLETINGQVPVTDYYTRENTNTGRIKIVGGQSQGLLEDIIDFDIDTKAKTFKGIFEVHTSTNDDVVVLGGETTLHKK